MESQSCRDDGLVSKKSSLNNSFSSVENWFFIWFYFPFISLTIRLLFFPSFSDSELILSFYWCKFCKIPLLLNSNFPTLTHTPILVFPFIFFYVCFSSQALFWKILHLFLYEHRFENGIFSPSIFFFSPIKQKEEGMELPNTEQR